MKKITKRILMLCIFFSIFIYLILFFIKIFVKQDTEIKHSTNINEISENTDLENKVYFVVLDNKAEPEQEQKQKKELNDWRLTLVNYENQLPIDFEPTLSYIDKYRQIDSRVLDELNQMLADMKKDGVKDIWIQSSYRSVMYQTELYNNKINEYIEYGETPENAERLTLKTINKPGTSEHNLGLAIDLNYVDYNFDKTNAYKWMEENAENYGFILRYRKEKEEITKIDYEPWHWRYIGSEHAKKMNELNMCLEEYVEYLLEN